MITAPSVNPGRLDRRLTLLAPLPTRSATGAILPAWVDSGTVWGQWLPANSREFISAQARHAETTGVFRIRHRSDIQATWAIATSNDFFRLAGDPIELGRREYLDLPVRAINQSPGDIIFSVLLLEGAAAPELLLLEDDTPLQLETVV
jgi:SPP1 family predicted phage head-tail adaptor